MNPEDNQPLISYQLHIIVLERCNIEIGKLGQFSFPPGLYIYTGSARKNIHARVVRHLSSKKKLRWHIDYLLNHPATQIIQVRFSSDVECFLNQQVDGQILIAGFGSSDCRSGCGSHLKYCDDE